jgi:hypothetical protein
VLKGLFYYDYFAFLLRKVFVVKLAHILSFLVLVPLGGQIDPELAYMEKLGRFYLFSFV